MIACFRLPTKPKSTARKPLSILAPLFKSISAAIVEDNADCSAASRCCWRKRPVPVRRFARHGGGCLATTPETSGGSRVDGHRPICPALTAPGNCANSRPPCGSSSSPCIATTKNFQSPGPGRPAILLKRATPDAILRHHGRIKARPHEQRSRPQSGGGVSTSRCALDTASELSTREREVLELLAQGLPDKEIASKLNISPPTVRYHLKTHLRQTPRPVPHGSRVEA